MMMIILSIFILKMPIIKLNLWNLEDSNLISSQQRNRHNTHNIHSNQSSLLCCGEDIENLNCNTVNLSALYSNSNDVDKL